MTDLRTQLIEDRHLRDSARVLVEASVENVRSEFSGGGLAGRAKDRLTDGATEVYDEAVNVAADNKGALAAIVAALVMWFARNPLSELLGDMMHDENDDSADPPEDGDEQRFQGDGGDDAAVADDEDESEADNE